MGKFSQKILHLYVDREVMQWGICGKIQEKENCSYSLPPIGDGAVQWERELDYSFLLPNCNFLFRLFQDVIYTMV